MVKIRFQREGKPKQAYYRLVAIEHSRPRDSRPIETIGTYNPRLDKDKMVVKEDRLKYWTSNGAKASDTVRTLLKQAGIWQRVHN